MTELEKIRQALNSGTKGCKTLIIKAMKELQDKLSAHRSSTPSRWREKAMERQANKEWLRYSQKTAMMMLDKMEELGITQKAVAERMGCSQQYIYSAR